MYTAIIYELTYRTPTHTYDIRSGTHTVSVNARTERSAVHTIVPSAKTTADDDRVLRYIGASDCTNHLRTVLRDTASFGLRTHHIP